jgi:hypothetical protein
MNDAGGGRSVLQHIGMHQVIDQQYAGGLNGFDRFERQQLGVSRTGADQCDFRHVRVGFHGVREI